METRQQARIFQHPFLERLTHTHIAVPLCVFCCYSLGLFWWSNYQTSISLPISLSLFFTGLFLWTLAEYGLHRFLFHHHEGSEMHYKLHGVHHAFPKDKDRLAMPPLISISVGTIFIVGGAQSGGRKCICTAGRIPGWICPVSQRTLYDTRISTAA